jgi:hypothetical protein
VSFKIVNNNGFKLVTMTGVAAGSIAAGLQGSAIISGSAFAVLQSAGAAGIGMVSTAVLGTAGAAVGYKAVEAVVD